MFFGVTVVFASKRSLKLNSRTRNSRLNQNVNPVLVFQFNKEKTQTLYSTTERIHATSGVIHQSFPIVARFIVQVNKLTPCVLREGHFLWDVKISYWGTADSDYNEA